MRAKVACIQLGLPLVENHGEGWNKGIVMSAVHRFSVDWVEIDPPCASRIAVYLNNPIVVGLSMSRFIGALRGVSHAEMVILPPEVPKVTR